MPHNSTTKLDTTPNLLVQPTTQFPATSLIIAPQPTLLTFSLKAASGFSLNAEAGGSHPTSIT